MNPTARYADLANRELQTGTVREPVWREAMTEAAGETTVAREIYRDERVAQNLEIEENFHAAREALRRLQEFNDSLGLSLGIKCLFLGVGFLGIVVPTLFLLARH